MVAKLLHSHFLFILDRWNISECGVKEKGDVLGSSYSWWFLLVNIVVNKSTTKTFGGVEWLYFFSNNDQKMQFLASENI